MVAACDNQSAEVMRFYSSILIRSETIFHLIQRNFNVPLTLHCNFCLCDSCLEKKKKKGWSKSRKSTTSDYLWRFVCPPVKWQAMQCQPFATWKTHSFSLCSSTVQFFFLCSLSCKRKLVHKRVVYEGATPHRVQPLTVPAPGNRQH